MPRVPLLGGAYQSRAIITSAQRCINLYPEENEDKQAPTPVTHFCTPGLTLKGTPPAAGIGRYVYRASNGDVYEVVDNTIYYVDTNYNYTNIGNIPSDITPVIMKDNGLAIVVCNGGTTGWAIKMNAARSFAAINDANFLGGTFVDFVDGFFVFNTPKLNQWQISLSYVTWENLTQGTITPPNIYAAFDPLDVASKTGSPDPIQGLVVMHRNIWTIGQLTTEIWYNSGAADFTFATFPGVYVEHGCIAPYSIATQDLSVFWLSQDRQGKCVVMRGDANFQVKELSAKGIEAIIGAFGVVSDAIGFCYQLYGHAYYVITFPTAGRSFQVELKTGQWTELAYSGVAGFERHRANYAAFGYGANLVCDRVNGKLYMLDPTAFTDNGDAITRVRTIPHLINDGKRHRIDRVIADVQGGKIDAAQGQPTMFLRVSYDRGGTFSDALEANIGAAGAYGELPWWPSLGIGRDFVFELSWSDQVDTALNGIWVESTPLQS